MKMIRKVLNYATNYKGHQMLHTGKSIISLLLMAFLLLSGVSSLWPSVFAATPTFSDVDTSYAGDYIGKQDGYICTAPFQENKTEEKIVVGKKYVVEGLVLNAYGEKWYKVKYEQKWIFEEYVEMPDYIKLNNLAEPIGLVEGGNGIELQGIITSNKTILTSISANVYDSNGAITTGKTISGIGSKTYNLHDINDYVRFDLLKAGTYRYEIVAKNSTYPTGVILYNEQFVVASKNTSLVPDYSTLSKVVALNVQAYPQTLKDSCGAAAAKAVLTYFNTALNVTDAQLHENIQTIEKNIPIEINKYLGDDSYTYHNYQPTETDAVISIIEKSLKAGNPVITWIGGNGTSVDNSDYFIYNLRGHYTTISGLYKNSSGEYFLELKDSYIITKTNSANDKRDPSTGTIHIPFSVITEYMQYSSSTNNFMEIIYSTKERGSAQSQNSLNLSTLTCAGRQGVRSDMVSYMDAMMKYYINSNSNLQSTLKKGKSVIFMFEGGSSNYSTAYVKSGGTRNQAIVFVVQQTNGNISIVFSSNNCSSLPDAEYSGSPTLPDGTYEAVTVDHKGNYVALRLLNDGVGGGIHIHSRATNNGDWGWSAGCQLVGSGWKTENEYNGFIKAVLKPYAVISDNVWEEYASGSGGGAPSRIKKLSDLNIKAGQSVGYYVLNRYLARDKITGLYTQARIEAITASSVSSTKSAGYAVNTQTSSLEISINLEKTSIYKGDGLPFTANISSNYNLEYVKCFYDNKEYVDNTVTNLNTSSYDIIKSKSCGIYWNFPAESLSVGSHTIRIEAKDGYGQTLSKSATFNVIGSIISVPSAPTKVGSSWMDGNKAYIHWTESAGATSYEVQYKTPAMDTWKNDSDYNSGTGYISSGLANHPYYHYRVRAVNSVGSSGWTEITINKTITVIFEGNGGTVPVTSKQITYNGEQAKLGELPTPTRPGCIFSYWSNSNDSTSGYTKDTSIESTSDITLYAIWKPRTNIPIHYYINSNKEYDSVFTTFGTPLGTLPVPTLEGYTFNGWYTSADGGTEITSSTVVTWSTYLNVYAHWIPNIYTVSFEAGKDVRVSPSNKLVSIGGTYGILPVPYKEGYVFNGWYTSASDGTRVYETTAVTTAYNHTLYAHWSEIPSAPYNLSATWLKDYSILISWDQVDTAATYDAQYMSNAQKWYSSSDYKEKTATSYISYTVGTNDTYKYRVSALNNDGVSSAWTDPYVEVTKVISVDLDANGGNLIQSVVIANYDSSSGLFAVMLPIPIREGFDFDGWYTMATDGNKVVDSFSFLFTQSTGAEPSITLYAYWNETKYNISFDANGGTGAPAVQEKTHGTELILSTVEPTRDGYTFLGWAESADATEAKYHPGDAYSFNESITLYAVWEENETPKPDGGVICVGSTTGRAGDTVDIAISLKDNPGVISMLLNVHYDNSVLTLTGYTDEGKLGTEYHNKNYSIMPYVLSWADDTATTDNTYTGTIVTLHFKISDNAAEGNYPITISYSSDDSDIYNSDWETVEFSIENGSVTVSNVVLGDVNGDGKVNGMDRTFLARHVAKWAGYSSDDIVYSAADVNGDGKVNGMDRTYLARYVAKWSGYEELIPYKPNLKLPQISVYSGNVNEPESVTDGQAAISVEKTEAVAGETVDIDISLENNPGIISMLLSVSYDSEALTLTGYTDAGKLGTEYHNKDYSMNPYILSWADDTATSDNKYSGVIVTLHFTVSENAAVGSYPITVSYSKDNADIYNSNWETVDFSLEQGSISVKDQSPVENVYTVSGTAAFWNDTDNAEYYLYSAETADADIRAAWQAGTHTELAGIEEYAVTKGDIDAATVDGKSMKAQSFSFEAVKAGEYKLAIFKPGKYVPKIVTVTVTNEAVELGSVKLWLYGDVNCDGSVDSKDATQITRYANLKSSVFDTGDDATRADRLLAADVSGDGSVDSKDATQITRFANLKSSIFDKLK